MKKKRKKKRAYKLPNIDNVKDSGVMEAKNPQEAIEKIKSFIDKETTSYDENEQILHVCVLLEKKQNVHKESHS